MRTRIARARRSNTKSEVEIGRTRDSYHGRITYGTVPYGRGLRPAHISWLDVKYYKGKYGKSGTVPYGTVTFN